MIDFYCTSTGIGDSLLRTQAVHELAKKDKVRLITRSFAWHGNIYRDNENLGINPIWNNNPDISEVMVVGSISPEHDVPVSGRQHHALDICNKFGIFPKEVELHVYPLDDSPYLDNRKSVGMFLRKIPEDSCVNYDMMRDIAEILIDNDVDVYQIDGEDVILENVDQVFKETSVKLLPNVIRAMDCVIGSTSGATHMAKALNIKAFDIWDWKRFKEHTPQVYTSYSYPENYNFSVNGPIIPGSLPGSVDGITARILGYLS